MPRRMDETAMKAKIAQSKAGCHTWARGRIPVGGLERKYYYYCYYCYYNNNNYYYFYYYYYYYYYNTGATPGRNAEYRWEGAEVGRDRVGKTITFVYVYMYICDLTRQREGRK